MSRLFHTLAALLVAQQAFAFNRGNVIWREQSLILVGSADCDGPIATESRPIRAPKNDPELLLRLKQAGKLPDQFNCGKCTYNLAGDPSVAYYVASCKR